MKRTNIDLGQMELDDQTLSVRVKKMLSRTW